MSHGERHAERAAQGTTQRRTSLQPARRRPPAGTGSLEGGPRGGGGTGSAGRRRRGGSHQDGPPPPAPIDPTAGLPPRTARLNVWRESGTGRESYGLAGVCCCGIALTYQKQPQQVKPSRLTLGDLIHGGAGGESPTKTFLRLISWSKDASEGLKGFLSEIRRAHGDDVRMIIEDVTGYDLPGNYCGTATGAWPVSGWARCFRSPARWGHLPRR